MTLPTSDEQLANLCHNLTVLRQRSGLTKAAMARVLRISLRSLTLLESGTVPVRLGVECLIRAKAYFQISSADLLLRRL